LPPSTRLVLDANVVVSAVLTNSIARDVVSRAIDVSTFIVSPEIVAEYQAVLARPKFDRYLSLDIRLHLLAEFLRLPCIQMAKPSERLQECRDPKDNKYLEAALAADAAVILSGDTDLLMLDPWRNIRIVRPASYLVLR
jgi:putative PIN family toxin of toxin-antitoxin system